MLMSRKLRNACNPTDGPEVWNFQWFQRAELDVAAPGSLAPQTAFKAP